MGQDQAEGASVPLMEEREETYKGGRKGGGRCRRPHAHRVNWTPELLAGTGFAWPGRRERLSRPSPGADKGSLSTALSNGAFLGMGVMTLLFLCLLLIIMRKRETRAQTSRPAFSRASTILDYINVFPKAGPLARNQKATPSSPSRPRPPNAPSQDPKKNQKDLPLTSLSGPGARPSAAAPESRTSQDELQYATLSFPSHRPRETHRPRDSHSDYAEIHFH